MSFLPPEHRGHVADKKRNKGLSNDGSTSEDKKARISQKMRLVADQIRGMPVEEALDLLTFSEKKPQSLSRRH